MPGQGAPWTGARRLLIENGNRRNPASRFVAVRTSAFLYAEWANRDRELYDLRRDPLQLDSAHADPTYAATRRALARQLATLRDCRGPACRR